MSATDPESTHTGPVNPATGRPFRARELSVVSNVTAGFYGGFTVELSDGSVMAGPYATKPDARQAKVDLVAGRHPAPAG